MTALCAICGLSLPESSPDDVCSYHHAATGTNPRASKIWCDYLHRGVPIVRVSWEDDATAYTEACD